MRARETALTESGQSYEGEARQTRIEDPCDCPMRGNEWWIVTMAITFL